MKAAVERKRDRLELQIDRPLALIRAYGTANPDEAFVELIEAASERKVSKMELFLRLLGRQTATGR